jgi:hypothetical protein
VLHWCCARYRERTRELAWCVVPLNATALNEPWSVVCLDDHGFDATRRSNKCAQDLRMR